MSATCTPIVPEAILQFIDGLGNPVWGIIMSIGLYGIILSLVWIYANKNSDEWYLRAIVAVLVMTNFACVVLKAELIDYMFLENYMDPTALDTFPRYMPTQVLLAVSVIFVVQIFFASRVYFVYDRSIIRGGLVVATACASFVPGILLGVDMYRKPAVPEVGTTYRKTIVGLFGGFAACCDISMTIMLSRRLYTAHSDVKRTNNAVQKLLIYVVTRGFLVSAVHITNLFLYVFAPIKLYWGVIYFCLSDVYLLTMLSMLNSRFGLRESMQEEMERGIDLRSVIGSRERARRGILDINVQTVQLVVKEGSGHTTGTADKDPAYSTGNIDQSPAV